LKQFKNACNNCSDGESKVDKFQLLLEASVLNLDELRQLSWSGVPAKLRSVTWRLLSVSRKGKCTALSIERCREMLSDCVRDVVGVLAS